MKGYAVSSETKKGCLLYLVFCGCILTGLGATTCVLYWKLGFDGGVAWRDNPAKQFAWHPILLTLSIVLSGIGGTLYKVLNISKPITKSIHAILMILAAASGAIGLWAVIDSHNLASPPIPNFFSLHSWVGISVLAVLGLQLLFGLIILLFPIPSSKKAGFMPLHKYFGILVFVGSVAAAIIGCTEEALFSLPNYTELPEKAVLINVLGVLLVVFSASVTFIITYRGFRRFA